MKTLPKNVERVVYKSKRAQLWELSDGTLAIAIPDPDTEDGEAYYVEMLPSEVSVA